MFLPTRRLIALAVFFLALMVAQPAVADVQQFLGRTITDVRVDWFSSSISSPSSLVYGSVAPLT